jgi:hypothetical protein
MRERNHLVLSAMDDHDALLAHHLGNLLQLLQTLVVPARSNELQDESWLGEILGVLPFPELVGGEAVTIGRKRLHNRLKSVWCVKPGWSVEILFHTFDLCVE